MSEISARAERPDAVVLLPLRRLRIGRLFRDRGVDDTHVNSLVAVDGRWPPILVLFSDHTVIDGVHRLRAAEALGLDKIAVVYFYGTRDEAYLAFVQQNARNGLPLTLHERTRAARHALARHGTWSDRRIAELCGISARTVSELRGQTRADAEDASPPALSATVEPLVRIGKDGRRRPVDPRQTRERIAAALKADPRGSLRAIASVAGASPETVRSVRARLLQLAPTNRAVAQSDGPVDPLGQPCVSGAAPITERMLAADAAFDATPAGSAFVGWFTGTTIGDDWREHVASIPLSRVYEVADEARLRAARWDAFANAVEARTEGRHGRRS